MKHAQSHRTSAAGIVAALLVSVPLAAQSPPVAPKVPHVTHPHGYTVEDDYFWLRERDNPEVLAYLRAEDGYADAMMANTAGLQDTLYKEMLARIKETDENVPYRRDGWFYYTRTEAGKQYPIYARRHGSMDSAEQVTLDLNVIGEGKAFVGIGAYAPSDDGNRLAFTLDTTGYRQYVLYVKDLRTGTVSAPMAVRVDGVAWSTDGSTLMYAQEDSVTKRTYLALRQKLGGKPEVVYEEKDELYDLGGQPHAEQGLLPAHVGECHDDRSALCAGEQAGRAGEGDRAPGRRAGVRGGSRRQRLPHPHQRQGPHIQAGLGAGDESRQGQLEGTDSQPPGHDARGR